MKGYCQKDRKPQGACAASPLNIYCVYKKEQFHEHSKNNINI